MYPDGTPSERARNPPPKHEWIQGDTRLRRPYPLRGHLRAETRDQCIHPYLRIRTRNVWIHMMRIPLLPLIRLGTRRRIVVETTIAPGEEKGHKRAWHLAALRWSAQPTRFRSDPRSAAVIPHPSSLRFSGLSLTRCCAASLALRTLHWSVLRVPLPYAQPVHFAPSSQSDEQGAQSLLVGAAGLHRYRQAPPREPRWAARLEDIAARLREGPR